MLSNINKKWGNILKENAAVFIGQSDVFELDIESLTKEITMLIENGITTFYSGGMGGFDRVSSGVVHRLKNTYTHIKNYLVIPYLSFNVFDEKRFDEIIFPEQLEGVPYKAAIPRRNKYMIEQSGTAICFVKHSVGGSAKSLEIAMNKGLNIVHIDAKHDS